MLPLRAALRLSSRLSVPTTLVVMTTASTGLTHCGFFGKSSAEVAEEREAEKRSREVEALRKQLGPLASLDLNGDGKIDEKDALLAVQMAKDVDVDFVMKKLGSRVSEIVETGVPAKLGWGFCSGYCAGFAAKKIGKLVAVVVGGIFCLLQTLHYNGYVTVDHEKIEKDFNEAFDLNHDGNLDQGDLKVLYDTFVKVVSFNVPSGSGFAAGLLLGLRSG